MAIQSLPRQFMTPPFESFQIVGLRVLKNLSLPSLGRITSITGKNSIGRTSVLDAVRIYANRATLSVINSILSDRNEFIHVSNKNGNVSKIMDYESLFHGEHSTDSSIDQMGEKNPFRVSITETDGEDDDGDIERFIRIDVSDRSRVYAINSFLNKIVLSEGICATVVRLSIVNS